MKRLMHCWRCDTEWNVRNFKTKKQCLCKKCEALGYTIASPSHLEEIKIGHLLTMSEMQKTFVFKCVRVDHAWRFFDTKHSHNIAIGSKETAEAAGMLAIYPDCLRIVDSYSSTLKVGLYKEDTQMLSELFGLPTKETE